MSSTHLKRGRVGIDSPIALLHNRYSRHPTGRACRFDRKLTSRRAIRLAACYSDRQPVAWIGRGGSYYSWSLGPAGLGANTRVGRQRPVARMAISCYKCQFPIQTVGRQRPVARMGIVCSPQYNRLGGSGGDWHSLLQRSVRKANSQESAANCPDRQIPSVWLSWGSLS